MEHNPDVIAPPAGGLTSAWRATIVVVWVGVAIGMASVWSASRQVGLSTWWLGPPTDGRPAVVAIAVFVPAVVVLVAAAVVQRHLWLTAVIAGVVVIVIGCGDIGRVDGLATVQIALGAAGAATGIAALSGTARRASTRPR
ncbi:MAG: hypothetical protein ACO20G_05805 [Ilumatobacteraceae bacterium]|nr:hypothetical protein [Actinomycetota bacterium]